MLKILKNGEKVIFRIKGSNAGYIVYDKLKCISPLNVSKGSERVKVSLNVAHGVATSRDFSVAHDF